MGPIDIAEIMEPVLPTDPKLLLHPLIPMGAARLNPRSVRGKEWWDATRKSSEKSSNYHCYACGIHKSDTPEGWLEGHEVYTMDYQRREMYYVRTVSLCHKCHAYIHCGLLLINLSEGHIDGAEYLSTILHGIRQLRTIDTHPAPWQIRCLLHAGKYLSGIQLVTYTAVLDSIPTSQAVRAVPAEMLATEAGLWTLIIGHERYTHADVLPVDVPPEEGSN